ncbi:hypothetical protein AWENTII_006294 [Aspergillus wentii]
MYPLVKGFGNSSFYRRLSNALSALSIIISQHGSSDYLDSLYDETKSVLQYCRKACSVLEEEVLEDSVPDMHSLISGERVRICIKSRDAKVLDLLMEVYENVITLLAVVILGSSGRTSSSFKKTYRKHSQSARRGMKKFQSSLQKHFDTHHRDDTLVDRIFDEDNDSHVISGLNLLLEEMEDTFQSRDDASIRSRRSTRRSVRYSKLSSSSESSDDSDDYIPKRQKERTRKSSEKQVESEGLQSQILKLAEEKALAAYASGNYTEAEPNLRRCIEDNSPRKQKTGLSKTIEEWRYMLAWILWQRKEGDEAIDLLTPVASSRSAPDMTRMDARHLMAIILFDRKEFQQAEMYCMEAIDMKKNKLGKSHQSFRDSTSLLSSIYRAQNKTNDTELLKAWASTQEENDFRALVDTAKGYYDKQQLTKAEEVVLQWVDTQVGDQDLNRTVWYEGKHRGIWGPNDMKWRDAFRKSLQQSFACAFLGYTKGCSMLHILAALDQPFLLEILLDQYAAINAETEKTHFTPLGIAISGHSSQAVEYLVKRGADVHTKYFTDRSILEISANSSELDLILSQPGWDLDANLRMIAETPRMLSVRSIVEALISKGADIETKYGDGQTTPLLKACQTRSEYDAKEIITPLLEAGANPNVSVRGYIGKNTSIDMTPLVYAAKNNFTGCVELLLQYGSELPGYLIRKPHKVNNNDAVQLVMEAHRKRVNGA